MPRYVALLRGVSPMNAKMSELKRCFERAGYENVKTILASGNVAFDTRARSELTLARDVETAMTTHLGRTFYTIIRASNTLAELLDEDPYAAHKLPADGKRVVTFLREPFKGKLSLPHVADGVHMLAMTKQEVFTVYTPNPKGPVFMTMIQKMFGENVTTRTWDTVRKCANA